MDSAQATFLSNSLIGNYIQDWLITGFLGAGKSAVVMSATRQGQQAAVKVFHPELIERYGEKTQLQRIEREKSLIGDKHPAIVEIYDGGKCSKTGHLFVAMEMVPYKNLREVLQAVPLIAYRSLIAQLASAAMYLEERGMAHRDIKPENIAVSADFSSLKLLDLGVLRPFGISELTDIDSRPFVGTLRYSSPEFLLRQDQETLESWRSTTFYQIGAVLHDLLMKKEIFHEFSEPYSVLVQAVLNENVHVFSADAGLVRLCKHCLVKDATTRLNLVSWSDFSLEKKDSDSTDLIKARIAARQKYYHASGNEGTIAAGEKKRLAAQQMKDLCARFATHTVVVLNSLHCFPLQKTSTDTTSGEKPVACLMVQFEKDHDLGLLLHLALHFQIELQDENGGDAIYRIYYGIALSPREIMFSEISPSELLCTGTADELVSLPIIEKCFLRALDKAYNYMETTQLAVAEITNVIVLKTEHEAEE